MDVNFIKDLDNYKNNTKCAICGKICNSVGNHLIEHKTSAQPYYDKYFRKPNEGRCIICGKDTKFKTIKIGYIGKYCSHSCMYSDKSHFNTEAWKNTRINKIKQFENEYNCIFANDLRIKYGHGWYSANIVNFIYMDSQTKFVSINDIQTIINYSLISTNRIVSHIEKDIAEFISSFYTGRIIYNTRSVIRPFELDIYLPDLQLAIEYNGTWYHSIENGKSKEYHLNKSLLCRHNQIRLIHIYEFEELDKQKHLLKNLILGKDLYNTNDFNKNNLIKNIPKPFKIYANNNITIYGAGRLEVN